MRNLRLDDITSAVGMPLKAGSLKHIQLAYREAFAALTRGFVTNYETGVGYILYGCINSGSGANYNISAGAIYYNEEIYLVDAAIFSTSGGQVPICTITTTYYTATEADLVTFTDSVQRSIHEIKKIVISAGTSGSGTTNYSALVDMRYRPVGSIGQVISWKLPSGVLTDYFNTSGLGTHSLVKGWAIANGSNGTDDFRGRVMVGLNTSDADFDTIGETGGAKTHTLTSGEQGTFTIQTKGDDGDSDSGSRISVERIKINGNELNTPYDAWGTINTVNLSNASSAHNNLQPYRVTLMIQRIS